MTHRTAPPAPATDLDQAPPGIATMRTTARRLLAEDAKSIGLEELETLRLALRGHIQLLVPVIEALTLGLPNDDVPKACALACTREAEMRLRLGVGGYPPVRMSVAMKLARSVNALCDHYENLTKD